MRLYVAIDLMSCVHPYHSAHANIPVSRMRDTIAAEWVHFHLQPELWIPSGHNDAGVTEIIPILLVDEKSPKLKYWRHEYHAGYKGKRKSHPQSLGALKDEIVSLWRASGGAVEMQPGFEADDFAGDLCRSIGSNDRVLLVSVDSDWSQLVSDRVVWLDTYSAQERKHRDQRPCVLDIQQVIKRWNSYPDHEPPYQISNPREVAERKHVLGDRADEIPPGEVVPFGIIDLYYPTYRPTPVDRDQYLSTQGVRLPVQAKGKPFYFFCLRKWDDYLLDYKTMTVLEIPHRDC